MAYYNTSNRYYNRRQSGVNSVADAKLSTAKDFRIIFLLGLLLGVLMPFLVDIALFGTPMPCQTIQSFEDGSSIQNCQVRR